MSRKTIIIYNDPHGKEPFTEWLKSIKDIKNKNRILARLNRIQLGNPGDYKYLGDGVSELRFHFGSGYRIYYGEIDNIIILLLCAGDKNTQERDIIKAKNYFKEYKELSK